MIPTLRRPSASLTPAIFALGLACADAPPPADSAPDPSGASTEQIVVRDAPLLEIGPVEGDSRYAFSSITASARTPEGEFVIADAGTVRVALFDADGRWLRDLGGAGDGPGEYRDPAALVVDDAGRIHLWDAAAWRWTVFAPDGTIEEISPVDPAALPDSVAVGLRPDQLHPVTTRTVALRLTSADSGAAGDPSAPDSATGRPPAAVVLASRDLNSSERLASTLGAETIEVQAPGGPLELSPPLARHTRIATHPGSGRLCWGDQSAPRVRCRVEGEGERASGFTVEWTDRGLPPAPFPLEMTAWRERTAALLAPVIGEAELQTILDGLVLPARRPPWLSIQVDAAGLLWIELGPGTNPTRSRWLLFDREGRSLGGTVTPPELRVLAIGQDHLIGVRTDEPGRERLVVHPIDRPAYPAEGA